MDGVASLDNYLESVCVSNEAGDVPDGELTSFEGESDSLSCASTEMVVAVDAGAADIVTSVDGLSTVTVTAWNGTLNVTNGTALLSAVHGVHVTSDEEVMETTDVGAGLNLSIDILADRDDDSEALRKSVSCGYYKETHGVWSERGVVLRGLDVAVGGGHVVVSVICANSHLTLFTISDESEMMRSGEYEAITRRWIGFGEGVKLLVLLEVLTTNTFLGLLLSWDHEAIVFGRADKAMTLYGAVLMTFLSAAFLFDRSTQLLMATCRTSGWRCGTCLCRRQ